MSDQDTTENSRPDIECGNTQFRDSLLSRNSLREFKDAQRKPFVNFVAVKKTLLSD